MTVADRGRLVGLAPLFASRRPDSFLRAGEIGFASTFGHSWGFYLEFVAAPGYAEPVTDLIWHYLLTERTDWSRLRFGRMPLRMSLLPDLVRCSATSGFPCVTKRGLRIMRGVLPDQVGELGSWIPSRNRRRKTRRMYRHLEEAVGPVELRSYRSGDEFERLLHALAQMNLRQRRHFGRRSNFEHSCFARCFAESSRLLAARGWLELNALFAGEHLAAVSVDLIYKGTLYAMQPAYDPAFARYDAGHILMAMVVDEAIRKGVRQLDMLPGGAYKQQYVPCDEPLMQAVVPGPTVSGAIPVGVELLRHSVGRAFRSAFRSNIPPSVDGQAQ
ncbi:MAG: GNAT family N-acetyltransferase [Armatimonadota bacterium]